MEPKELSLLQKIRNTVIVLGVFWCLMMGFIWLVSKAPEAKPVTLVRGQMTTVDALFCGPSMGSTRAVVYLPKKTFLDRNWQGWSFAIKNQERDRYEVVRKGEKRGVLVTLGEARIERGHGVGQVHIRAHHETPSGVYKIWLKGAYDDYTRVGVRGRLPFMETKDSQKGLVIPTVVVDVK